MPPVHPILLERNELVNQNRLQPSSKERRSQTGIESNVEPHFHELISPSFLFFSELRKPLRWIKRKKTGTRINT